MAGKLHQGAPTSKPFAECITLHLLMNSLPSSPSTRVTMYQLPKMTVYNSAVPPLVRRPKLTCTYSHICFLTMAPSNSTKIGSSGQSSATAFVLRGTSLLSAFACSLQYSLGCHRPFKAFMCQVQITFVTPQTDQTGMRKVMQCHQASPLPSIQSNLVDQRESLTLC